MDSRVFWGVLCALLVFSGIWAVWFALGAFAQRQAVSDAYVKMNHQAELSSLRVRRDEAHRRAVDLSRRRLAADQRCVAGVVIVAHGSTYSDLGTVGNPVKCSGGYADRPLR